MGEALIPALHALPFDILAAVMNPLLQSVCVNSQMILMKLPQPDGDATEYMKNLHALVKDLPHGTELTWPAMRSAFDHPELCTIDMVIVGDWDWHVEFSSRLRER